MILLLCPKESASQRLFSFITSHERSPFCPRNLESSNENEMAGDSSSLILIDVDLTRVVQSDELVFEIIASTRMIHMGLCCSSTSSFGWSLTFESRARNGRAPKTVVHMPQAVILILLSWSGASMILTRKPEATRLHQRCGCYTVVTRIRSYTVYMSPIVVN